MKILDITLPLFEYYDRITEDSNVKIIKSSSFEKSYKKILRNPQVIKAMNNFIKSKTNDPTKRVGNSDYPFTGNNILGGTMHCALSRDISVIYLVHGRNPAELHLIEIGSHRDFGTGTPSNQNKIKSLAKRINHYRSSKGI